MSKISSHSHLDQHFLLGLICAILLIASTLFILPIVSADNVTPSIQPTGTAISISAGMPYSFEYTVPNSTTKIGIMGFNITPIYLETSYVNQAPSTGTMLWDDSLNQTWLIPAGNSSDGNYQIVTVSDTGAAPASGWWSWI